MKTKVEIIESEAGWGQRTDEVRTLPSRKQAEKFIKKYNSANDKKVTPSWYMYARILE